MSNPIPTRVRGWLYVAGIIVGAFIVVVLPDLMTALKADAAWATFATRAAGALTLLLSTLGRANLSDPAAVITLEATAKPTDQPTEESDAL